MRYVVRWNEAGTAHEATYTRAEDARRATHELAQRPAASDVRMEQADV